MRIAISSDGDVVSAHFGRCPYFTIADIDKAKLIGKQTVANPGHHPGFLPQFLKQQGVDCIIAGGMGPRAADLFSQAGIRAIVGVSGSIDEVIDKIAQGRLQAGPSLCQPGSGKGYGIEKTECDHSPNGEAK